MQNKTILIIDDDEMNLQVAKMVLERKLPCKIIIADNGVDGIEILKAQRVNLVLLDVMMPDFDGIETLQAIRANPFIKDVPVMMLTATVNMETVKKAGLLGVKDYIKKPFLPADLVARVEKKLAEELPRTDILIIGEDLKVLSNLREVIENNFHHSVLIAADYDEAIEILRGTRMSLIIACGEMTFIDGFKILTYIAGDDRAGLEPPPITQLLRKLKLNENALTLDEAEKLILKNFPRK